MPIKRLLNFSTHSGDLDIFDNDWEKARSFLKEWEFDGFELYPVGNYPFTGIPGELIQSLHLRFFVILRQIWENDQSALERIFGNLAAAGNFYGGTDRQTIIDIYVQQFELALKLGCGSVVFHPAHCELEYIYKWNFPWNWRETLNLCAEVINEVMARTDFTGMILFENLWWPGSFRLEDPAEYDYLRSRIEHQNCGIVLDTGHLLNRDGGFDDEEQAIAWLLQEIKQWGKLRREIKALHLTCSLSGAYIRKSQNAGLPAMTPDFRKCLTAARRHVMQIDRHNPFTNSTICRLFDLIEPEQVVFEFSFKNLAVWQDKIAAQRKALSGCLWPH